MHKGKGRKCRFTDSVLNHTGTYYYAKGKILIHLRYVIESSENCSTPGQYLRYYRKFRRISTQALADKIGIVPATIVLYENDRHDIPYDTAVAIAGILGIDWNCLLNEYTRFVDYPYNTLLKQVRTQLGMSQMQFSQEIGVAQSAYSKWERGAGKPRRQEYDKVKIALTQNHLDIHCIMSKHQIEIVG